MKSLKQKQAEAHVRLGYRLLNPVPEGQDQREKKYPQSQADKQREYEALGKKVRS